MLGFYRANAGAIPASLSLANNGDVFFPHYVSHFLPTGVPGLVLAGLLAAAMSSLSSGINSTITVIATDFIEPFRSGPPLSDKKTTQKRPLSRRHHQCGRHRRQSVGRQYSRQPHGGRHENGEPTHLSSVRASSSSLSSLSSPRPSAQ